MRDHPLTPMRDPDIRRVLARQCRGAVGHAPHAVVARGPEAIRAACAAEGAAGRRLVVVDAVSDAELRAIGRAAASAPLLVGGSGIGLGLPANHALQGGAGAWRGEAGPVVALAGSVSQATQGQVTAHRAAGHPARAVDPDAVMAGALDPKALARWALSSGGVPLIHSTADAASVAAAQARHGREALAAAIEALLAATAAAAVAQGAARVISAGGETSGAVVAALGVTAMAVGPEIDPGVPALRATGRPLTLALKSGNFGAADFFAKAAATLGA